MLLKTYIPGHGFPAISLSGPRCELHCQHCDATYLGGMKATDTPDKLLAVCHHLREQGVHGVLLSGGADRRGRLLNLANMLPAIRQAKAETGLIFNIHPGLMTPETAQALAVDFVSLEIPGKDTIQNVFGLDAGMADYMQTYRYLKDAGQTVVPHICIYDGDEYQLLEDIETPETIVVIVFSPTRNTPMVDVAPPTPDRVGRVIACVKAMFPHTEIGLGCMRPRRRALREAMEQAALDAGATRIALPARGTLRYAEERGFDIQRFNACCALPRRFESQITKIPGFL